MDTTNTPTCTSCRHYLGGGCCRINLEADCAAGGYEAWEPRKEEGEVPKREEVLGALQMMLKTDGKWFSNSVIIDTITFLRSQEAVGPVYDDYGYRCGACDSVLNCEYLFCPSCGKEINWDESTKAE